VRKLFIFGYGFSAQALADRLRPQGWTVAATTRDSDRAALMEAQGVAAVDPSDRPGLTAQVRTAQAILVTAPPGEAGCPGLNGLVPALAAAGAFPDWIGYLSTTGVYGDRDGRWAFEASPLAARSPEAARRVSAERDWLDVGRGMGLTVQIFRLPGIYGPGRSALDRVADASGRNIVKPGQVFSRIHVDDIAGGLAASLARPRPGGIYNLTDDEPAPSHIVNAWAARLLGLEPPTLTPWDPDSLPPAARRFWSENKRVSNALAKAELGWRPAFPTYREGLTAILEAQRHLQKRRAD
jgi:nucleoside-diphosphate-sugar epimerase